jgi:hypothetical protein
VSGARSISRWRLDHPIKHAPSPKRDPPIRFANRSGEIRVERVAVSHVEQPAAITLSAFSHDRDRLIDP